MENGQSGRNGVTVMRISALMVRKKGTGRVMTQLLQMVENTVKGPVLT